MPLEPDQLQGTVVALVVPTDGYAIMVGTFPRQPSAVGCGCLIFAVLDIVALLLSWVIVGQGAVHTGAIWRLGRATSQLPRLGELTGLILLHRALRWLPKLECVEGIFVGGCVIFMR